MTITQARAALPELLDRVDAGEEITITRHGRPVAVLVRPDALRPGHIGDASAAAQALGEDLAARRLTALSVGGGLSEARADELVAEVRASRHRR